MIRRADGTEMRFGDLPIASDAEVAAMLPGGKPMPDRAVERTCPCCKSKTRRKIRTHDENTGQPLDPPKVYIVSHRLGHGGHDTPVAVFDDPDEAETWRSRQQEIREGSGEVYDVQPWRLRLYA